MARRHGTKAYHAAFTTAQGGLTQALGTLMSMFGKSTKAEHFGTLEGEGRSKVWETKLDIVGLGNGFFVRVHGLESGPSEDQIRAFGSLIANASGIRLASTKPTIEFLESCKVVPDDVDLTDHNLWSFLVPSFIEVGDNNEYPDGEGPEGSIAISLGYEIPWETEHLLQIAVINGNFQSVYSE